MTATSGWIGLFLIAYNLFAVFYADLGAKKVIKVAASGGELQAEAGEALKQNYRSRILWLRKYREQLPAEIRDKARRIVAVEYSGWGAAVVLFIIYGLQFLT